MLFVLCTLYYYALLRSFVVYYRVTVNTLANFVYSVVTPGSPNCKTHKSVMIRFTRLLIKITDLFGHRAYTRHLLIYLHIDFCVCNLDISSEIVCLTSVVELIQFCCVL